MYLWMCSMDHYFYLPLDRVAQMVKRLSTMRETWVRSLEWEDPLEKEMAIHSRTIAWKIPWTGVIYQTKGWFNLSTKGRRVPTQHSNTEIHRQPLIRLWSSDSYMVT